VLVYPADLLITDDKKTTEETKTKHTSWLWPAYKGSADIDWNTSMGSSGAGSGDVYGTAGCGIVAVLVFISKLS
jgi:hypothetical protein